jgi:hypothetical protein
MKNTFTYILFAICALSMFSCRDEKTVIYVNNFELFDKFQMKKDYDKLITVDLKSDSKQLDSLSNILEFYQKMNVSLQKFDSIKQYYIVLKTNFDKKFEKISQSYTNQVNIRLNQYLKDYSKEHDIKMILGNGNQGSLLYIDEELDYTKEVIVFVNNKYRG